MLLGETNADNKCMENKPVKLFTAFAVFSSILIISCFFIPQSLMKTNIEPGQ